MVSTAILRYNGTKNDRFDREYYCNSHMPAVAEKWKEYGLVSAQAFFPALAMDKAGTVCICECVFDSENSLKSAFAAECTAELIADIKNFTDLEMQPAILAPLA